MPDDANHPANTPKRPRTARSPRRTGRKRTVQATPSPTPELENAAPLVAQNLAGSMAPQSIPMPEASAQPAPDQPLIGESWGDFPLVEHRAELKRMLEAWDQEHDHGDRPGPFTHFALTGADVCWLAALTAGAVDVSAGKKALDENPKPRVPSLHLGGARLIGAHLEGALLKEAHLESALLFGALRRTGCVL